MEEEQQNSNEPTSSFNPSIQPPPNPTPPPQPQMPSSEPTAELRTMESDTKYAEKGEEPSPQSFKPETPPFSASEEPIFKPVEPALPEEPKIVPPPPLKKQGKKSSGKLLAIIIAIAVVAAAGAAGYFFVWPILSSRFFSPVTETPPPEETPETGGETIPTIPSSYTSLFVKQTASQENLVLEEMNIQSLKEKLNASALTNTDQNVKEIIFKDSSEELLSFADLLPVILPEFVAEDLAGYFGNSLTAFLYTDANGSWPGYIAQVLSNDVLLQAKSTVSEIENSNNLKNFFLTDTDSSQGFKSGQVGEPAVPTRYLIFEKAGAALNYGWLDNKLIITASYSAFQKALEHLR